jgi:radical SAM-linked protein
MRFRIAFAKTNAMRFTSHLDLQRTWERTIRRARLPLSYSQGFNPRPKINLAAALPLGFTSSCEIAEIWLDDEALGNLGGTPEHQGEGSTTMVNGFAPQEGDSTFHGDSLFTQGDDREPWGKTVESEVETGEEYVKITGFQRLIASEVKTRLRDAAPPGIEILQVEDIDPQEPKIQTLVDNVVYDITLDEPVADLEIRVKTLLSQKAIIRKRRGKEYDLRPLIEAIEVIDLTPSGKQRIRVSLAARPGSTGRPDEVLAALEIEPYQTDIQRTALILKL